MSGWIVVTDFDGTLTENDLGNDLATEIHPDLFHELYAKYRSGEFTLTAYLTKLWTGFPLPEAQLRRRAREIARFRPGVNEFFKLCAREQVPLYIASCGLVPAIESALELLEPEARKAVHGLCANDVRFDAQGICKFLPPHPESPYPIDKGQWCLDLKVRHTGTRCLGIGNGTADKTLWPAADRLAARDKLARWCEGQGVAFIPFADFHDLTQPVPAWLR